MNPRWLAARIVDEVTEGRSLTEALRILLPTISDTRDRALVQAICYGVCRYYTRLDVILSHLLQKPMKSKDSDVHALLLVGLYQLMDMRIPAHAAVAETVNAAVKTKKPWAKGLVNAVLRAYIQKREALDQLWQSDLEAQFAHPQWWISYIKKAWPLQWDMILSANNEHPPFSLRVNARQLTREAYLARHPEARAMTETTHGVILDKPVTIDAVPGFLEAEVTVQDGAAQLAAEYLELSPGLRVLDACAAPGGKLTHLLERELRLSACVAVEVDKERLQAVRDNLSRLGLAATCLCADAGNPSAWWDGQLFDRILLDAPCSASGVIRRHPDIKLLREPSDLKKLHETQYALLEALWPLLAPGGIFMYATCSIFPEENTDVVKAFLTAHADAMEYPIDATWGMACVVGRQILPGMHEMDGFYYARLRKRG